MFFLAMLRGGLQYLKIHNCLQSKIRVLPKLSFLFDDVSPGMTFLVHERIQRHCTLHTSRNKYGMTLRADPPWVLALLGLNQRGPVTVAKIIRDGYLPLGVGAVWAMCAVPVRKCTSWRQAHLLETKYNWL